MVWSGAEWCGVVWGSSKWCGVVQGDMEWCGVVWIVNMLAKRGRVDEVIGR